MSKKTQKREAWEVREERTREKRKIPRRRRYLICTEGNTEVIHLVHYKSSTGPLLVLLDKSDHKISLVKKAIEEQRTRILNGQYDEKLDETWVVFDRDADPINKFDKGHFNQAIELAKANNIHVAYSNDSFELWFLLHYQDLWTATHRDQLCKMLSKHRSKKYEKSHDLYKEIKPFRSLALKRAAKLLKPENHPENANPSTTVHLLVEKLMNEPGFREED